MQEDDMCSIIPLYFMHLLAYPIINFMLPRSYILGFQRQLPIKHL